MIRYLAFSLLLIVIALEIHRFLRIGWSNWRTLLVLGAVLFILMLIFDTYLTALPIVEYNKSLVLGLHIGTIPLEDFSYLIVVIIAGPALFEYFKKTNEESRKK